MKSFFQNIGVLAKDEPVAPVAPPAAAPAPVSAFGSLIQTAKSVVDATGAGSTETSVEVNQENVNNYAEAITSYLQAQPEVALLFKFTEMWPKLEKIPDVATRFQVALDAIDCKVEAFKAVIATAETLVNSKAAFEFEEVKADNATKLSSLDATKSELEASKASLEAQLAQVNTNLDTTAAQIQGINDYVEQNRREINVASATVSLMISHANPVK